MIYLLISFRGAMHVLLRQAIPSDAIIIHHIEEQSFAQNHYHQEGLSRLQTILHDPNYITLVIENDTHVFGAAIIHLRKNSCVGRLYSIAILPEYQGGVMGKKLFGFAQDTIKKAGKSGMSLEIRDDNQRHFERYSKLGFKKIRRLLRYYPDGADAIKMIKYFEKQL